MSYNTESGKLLSLEGKAAVVTGAASGIGRATARRLAQAGANVALLDINEAKGKKAVGEIHAAEGKAVFIPCDVTSDSDCQKAASSAYKTFGRIDVLVNSAGVIRRKNIVDLQEEEWDLVINVNLKSIFLLSRQVIPLMIKGGGGCIVNIGSGWGIKGGPKAAAYCAAKGGVVNLTRAMAIDHGKDSIRVNCICPGDTDTPLLRSEATQLGRKEEMFLREAAERPLHRIGQPEDIANAVLYLVSDISSWVTGSVLVVDGGGIA